MHYQCAYMHYQCANMHYQCANMHYQCASFMHYQCASGLPHNNATCDVRYRNKKFLIFYDYTPLLNIPVPSTLK